MKTWTTRDGKILLITEMTDSHVLNSANMLQRKLHALDQKIDAAWSGLAGCGGDMAQYYGMQEVDHLVSERSATRLTYEVLINELKRRETRRTVCEMTTLLTTRRIVRPGYRG